MSRYEITVPWRRLPLPGVWSRDNEGNLVVHDRDGAGFRIVDTGLPGADRFALYLIVPGRSEDPIRHYPTEAEAMTLKGGVERTK